MQKYTINRLRWKEVLQSLFFLMSFLNLAMAAYSQRFVSGHELFCANFDSIAIPTSVIVSSLNQKNETETCRSRFLHTLRLFYAILN